MAVDLPESPNNREEQYLASIAGQNVEVPECPWSRKEAYLDAIDGRIADLQDELEELENNPDVADIVDTYADLEAYDTSTLTDKDIIRVLNDETHDGNSTYYRYSKATDSFTYIGSSKTYDVFTGTDGTTAGAKGLVPAPATTDAGKFLKADGSWGAIPDEILTNAGAPTTSTAGTLGQLLTDTTNAKLYQLTAIDTTDPQNPSYTWSEVGGSSVNVVQTTGTSTTDVMSQNAVSSMIFPYIGQSGKTTVSIGTGSTGQGTRAVEIGQGATATSRDGVAIGLSAEATGGTASVAIRGTASGTDSVAIRGTASGVGAITIGTGAVATVQGQFDIGTSGSSTPSSYGYNSSNYRLLSGVYDGQSAHDAATVAQGNTLATAAPTTSTVGVLGQLYTDTTNMHTYQCTAIDTTDPDNPSYTWTQRW